ncbi:hypothetical protein JK386_00520 [Nocardioides sp. zg-536]|uniref:Serine acetyltransferase n=1 Tax=Nocardioides faecalis TaxID=2803858 RepID=A0A939BUD2_9ACTN|nr:hypothetical protein [Nocardioides faecalis]MBM9458382.1 hypothetical protein [Nocardioides faecalis]QVI58401.1 hypothetical protein KG111_15600 [Nocardioides faecalis]
MTIYRPILRVLVHTRRVRGLRRISRLMFRLLMVDIPIKVPIGPRVQVYHNWVGVVISSQARIGSNVHIFHNVTIGRRDPYLPEAESPLAPITIEDDVFLCVGCVVLGGAEPLRVGRGTVVGANAVLTQSTGDWEVWAGIPARKIGVRPRPQA